MNNCSQLHWAFGDVHAFQNGLLPSGAFLTVTDKYFMDNDESDYDSNDESEEVTSDPYLDFIDANYKPVVELVKQENGRPSLNFGNIPPFVSDVVTINDYTVEYDPEKFLGTIKIIFFIDGDKYRIEIVPPGSPTNEQVEILSLLGVNRTYQLPESYTFVKKQELPQPYNIDIIPGKAPKSEEWKFVYESDNYLTFVPSRIDEALNCLVNPDQTVIMGHKMTIYYATHLDEWIGRKIVSQDFTLANILREAASMYPLLGDILDDDRYNKEMYWLTTRWIHVNAEEKFVVIQTEF